MTRVLVIVTQPWVFPNRIIKVFAAAGCLVAAICPKNHQLRRLSSVASVFDMPPLFSHEAIRRAVEQWRPSFILPCDDEAAYRLHRTRRVSSTAVQSLIELSLGTTHSYDITSSKIKTSEAARGLDVLCPDTLALNEEDLRKTSSSVKFPCVLKLEYGFGGLCVRIVDSQASLLHSIEELRNINQLSVRDFLRTLKRRSLWPVAGFFDRREGQYLLQSFVEGRPANRAVLCFEGEVLAGVSVEVSHSQGKTGPGAIISFLDNKQMEEATRKVVSFLSLSGIYGFDFIIEEHTRKAFLLEINPRATPIVHLTSSNGTNLIGALAKKLTGKDAVSLPPAAKLDSVALFPDGVALVAQNRSLEHVHLDVPWDEPWLLEDEGRRNSVIQEFLASRP